MRDPHGNQTRPVQRQSNAKPANEQPAVELPPQNLDAERSVIGSIFFHNDALDEVADILRPEYFYLDSHRKVFEAILRLRDANKRAFDAVTVGEEIERVMPITEIGGYEYLQDIIECVPHAAHAIYYANTVREKAMRRMAMLACGDGVRESRNELRPVEEVIGQIDASLMAIVEHKSHAGKSDIASILLDAMAAIQAGRGNGVPTGFADLDKLTNGLQPGTVSILAARTSMGKTAFIISMLLAMAEAGTPVLFFSLEQSKQEIVDRIWSLRCGISCNDLRKPGKLTEDQLDVLLRESSTVSEWPFFIDDDGDRDVTQIESLCRVQQRKHGIKFVAIDYLQLIRAHDGRISREQQVAHISRRLKAMAKSLSIPVLALAQLSRGIENRDSKRPRLADLRESGAIEQDADIVMFLDRPAVYDNDAPEGLARIFLDKQRNGPKGEIALQWTPSTMQFRPGTQAHYDDGATYYRPEQEEQEQRQQQYPRSRKTNDMF